MCLHFVRGLTHSIQVSAYQAHSYANTITLIPPYRRCLKKSPPKAYRYKCVGKYTMHKEEHSEQLAEYSVHKGKHSAHKQKHVEHKGVYCVHKGKYSMHKKKHSVQLKEYCVHKAKHSVHKKKHSVKLQEHCLHLHFYRNNLKYYFTLI